jgi:hypothetical protein
VRAADVEAEVRRRGERRGSTAARDLRRYYALLAQCLAEVSLSEPEALLVCEALRGHAMDERSYDLLFGRVALAIAKGGLDRAQGVDGDALVRKLQALDRGQAMSVVDAVERLVLAPEGTGAERLRAVGLVRSPLPGP